MPSSWSPVPWFVGGGKAVHSAEVARGMVFAASGGVEGVIGGKDLRVRELVVPSGSIRVMDGACLIINRSVGGENQTYAGLNLGGEEIPVTPTGSGSGRSDLVVARVEDPQYAPWDVPEDEEYGPYIFTRIIEDVPDDTETAAEIDDTYSWIALARIDIPASTATITNAMIKNLRKVARPQQQRYLLTATPEAIDELDAVGVWTDWPVDASFPVTVPVWANKARIVAVVSGAYLNTGNAHGQLRVKLGATDVDPSGWDALATAADAVFRISYATGGVIDVDESYLGTEQTLKVQGKYDGGDVPLVADTLSFVYIDIQFIEETTDED